MVTPNNDLLDQLRNAIAGWTAEVGAAQQGLSQQIDGANAQLTRLLAVLQERQQLTASLARANGELEQLKRAMQQDQLPAGAMTRYAVDQSAPADSAVRELDSTIGKLYSAVQSWTSQVTRSQGGLLDQFGTANQQLSQLLEILSSPRAAAPPHVDPALTEELEQLRHENRVLSSEVHALNIEMETLRCEQESFASENLAAETERTLKQRRDLDQLKSALADSEARLAEARRDADERAREADLLRKEASRLELSEERLHQAVNIQRQETTQHVAALGALTREMEALRRAFLGEEEHTALEDSDVTVPENAPESAEALADANAHIAALEATVAQLELSREETNVLQERLAEQQALTSALEDRPTLEEYAALQERVDTLTEELAQRPDVETLATLQEHADTRQAELASRPTLEEVTALQERVDTLTAELESRPDPEALQKLHDELALLQATITQLRAENEIAADAAAADRVAEADALREQMAAMQVSLDAMTADTSAAELAEAKTRIATLEEEVRALEGQQTASEDVHDVLLAEERAGLQAALARMEAELASLKRREEDTVATARTLLDELETHRTYEAAQDTALAMARNEASRLQDLLTERQQQVATQGAALAAAETERDSTTAALEEAIARRDALAEAVATLEAQVATVNAEREAAQQTAATLQMDRDQWEAQCAAQDTRLQSLEADLPAHAEALMKASALEAALETARARISDLEGQVAGPDPDVVAEQARRDALLEQQVGELQECRDSLQIAEKWIADLDQQLDDKTKAHVELEAQHRELAERCDTLSTELDALRAQESALRDALDEARGESKIAHEKRADSERDSQEYAALLEEQEVVLGERDTTIEALRKDVAHLEVQRDALSEKEADASQQSTDLSEALAAMRMSDAECRDELEEKRALVGELRAELARMQAEAAEQRQRSDAMEGELKALQERDVSTLATLEDLRGSIKLLEQKEREQEIALEDREKQLSELEAQLNAIDADRNQVAEVSQARETELREAMTQVNQALHERDELAEELEAEKKRRGRIYAGTVGEGFGASEARDAKDERARQQEILVSEVSHAHESRSLGDILVDAGILTRDQLTEALTAQQQDPSQLLGTILIEREYTTDDAIAQAVACQLEKPVVNPMEVHIEKEAIAALNRDICTWHVCVPLRITSERLVVAMANPFDESAIMKLRDLSQREITPVVGTASRIMGAIDNHYGTF